MSRATTVPHRYTEANIRSVIRHSAKRHLLEGKCQTVVSYKYDGNKLYATYDSGDGQTETFEVSIELKLLEEGK